MKNDKILLRWLIFITGLFIMSLGVAFSVKANLGISPVSCIPYIFSLKFSLTIGNMTIIFNTILIVLQILLLRKKYQPIQLLQLPVAVIFGFFIDFALYLFSGITVTLYLWRFVFCLLSCLLIAFAVFIEVKARVTYLPGEGLALAISEVFHVEFGKAKIGVDCNMVAIGIVSSFVLLGSLQGVREGTVIAAFLVGYIAKYLNRKIKTPKILSIR